MSDSLKKIWRNRTFFKKSIDLLISSEWSEQIAQDKWATVRDSLRSLTKNEQMSELLTFWVNHSFAHFFSKKQAIRSKIPNPEQKFLLETIFRTTVPFRNYSFSRIFSVHGTTYCNLFATFPGTIISFVTIPIEQCCSSFSQLFMEK